MIPYSNKRLESYVSTAAEPDLFSDVPRRLEVANIREIYSKTEAVRLGLCTEKEYDGACRDFPEKRKYRHTI